MEKEIIFMITKGGGKWEGELDKGSQKYKFPVIRQINIRDVMYSMINTVNTAVCYIWKLLRE